MIKKRPLLISIFIIGLVGFVASIYFGFLKVENLTKLWVKTTGSVGSPTGYVAVYLDNGKVYFGKISEPESAEPVLSDVFYLSVSGPGEQSSSLAEKQKTSSAKPGEEQATVVTTPQTEFQLVRITDQFQAPTDRLTISRDHILYWEELAPDSKVVQAITKFHESQGK